MCKGRPETVKECNSLCLQTVSQISIHGEDLLVIENRGDVNGAPNATLSISSLQPQYLAGTPACRKGKICPVQMLDLTTGNHPILGTRRYARIPRSPYRLGFLCR